MAQARNTVNEAPAAERSPPRVRIRVVHVRLVRVNAMTPARVAGPTGDSPTAPTDTTGPYRSDRVGT